MPRASPYNLAPLTALTGLRSLTLRMVLRDDFTEPLSELRALTRLELSHVDQQPYSLRFEVRLGCTSVRQRLRYECDCPM